MLHVCGGVAVGLEEGGREQEMGKGGYERGITR